MKSGNGNGAPAAGPATLDLVVAFEPNTQTAGLKFRADEYRNWAFVLAVLKMAQIEAEHQLKVSTMMSMQNQLLQQQQNEALAQRVLRG